MSRLVRVATVTLLALIPLGAAGHTRARPHHIPVVPLLFGPSVRLSDPSRYPADDPQYARQALPGAEPSVAVAADGTVWVAALHEQHGTALWRGRVGTKAPAFVGLPDGGVGGNDVALALGANPPISPTRPFTPMTPITGTGVGAPITGTLPVSSLMAPPTLYVAALTSITQPVAASRVVMTACPRSDIAHAFRACALYPHLVYGRRDRPWLATYGRATVYLSYLTRGDDQLSGHVTVRRSDDAGVTWQAVGDPVAALPPVHGWSGNLAVHGWSGNLAVDPRDGTVYEVFVTETPGQMNGGADDISNHFNRIVVARSHDGGATWRDTLVYQGGSGEDDANMWPGLAIDAAGRLYAAWSDRRRVLLSSSTDGGTIWSPARRIAAVTAIGARASVLPSITAGAAGHVALAWYGADTWDSLSPRARWRVYAATSSDGGAAFSATVVTDVVHQGPICTKGDACPDLQRQLLDNLGLALDPRTNRAVIAYGCSIEFGDYRACRRAANCPQTYYVEQVAP